jgi:hypothetical protein
LFRCCLAAHDPNTLAEAECRLDQPMRNVLGHDVDDADDEFHRAVRRARTDHIE